MDPLQLFEYETCRTFNTWYAIIISTSVWSTCYFLVQKIFYHKSPEWCSRVLTLVHGTGSSITGLAECATSNFFENWNKPQTDNQQFILLVSLGYFVFDLMWCLYYQTESKVMLLHHILSSVGLYRLLRKNYAGSQTCCGVGGMEVTNPILQMRWFIRNSDFDRVWFMYADIVFAIFFIIMRCGFGTYFFVNVVFFHDFEHEYMLYTTVLYVISWLFVINVLQYLIVKYWKRSDSNIKTTTVNSSVNTAVQNVTHSNVQNATSVHQNSAVLLTNATGLHSNAAAMYENATAETTS